MAIAQIAKMTQVTQATRHMMLIAPARRERATQRLAKQRWFAASADNGRIDYASGGGFGCCGVNRDIALRCPALG